MTEIIKTGMYIEGVEITSEHIGQKVILDENIYDLDSEAVNIIDVVGDEVMLHFRVRSLNMSGDSYDWFCPEDLKDVKTVSRWKWADRSIVEGQDKSMEVEDSSKIERKILAENIRNAEKELQKAIANAEECGMMVSGLQNTTIKYQPPMEEY